jgi:hypothetical protein
MGKILWIKLNEKPISNGKHLYYICRCICGLEKLVRKSHFGKESLSCRTCSNKTHGDSKTKLYRVFRGMHERCYDVKNKNYYMYGERGISVCKEWSEWEIFKKWALENGYAHGLSIDRINHNGNYEPSNCRWATSKEQAQNTRRNKNYTINGKTLCVTEWARKFGINEGTLKSALYRGANIESYLKEKGKYGKN